MKSLRSHFCILTLFSILSVKAVAQGGLETITELSSAINNPEQCLEQTQEQSQEELIRACLRRICPDDIETAVAVNEFAAITDLDDYFFEELMPITDRIQAKSVQQRAQVKTALRDWIRSAPNITDPELIRYFNLRATENVDPSLLRFDYVSAPEFSRERTLEAMGDSPSNRRTVQRLANYYEQFFSNKLNLITDSSTINLHFENEAELRRAIDQAFDDIAANSEWLRQNAKNNIYNVPVTSRTAMLHVRESLQDNIQDPAALRRLGEVQLRYNLSRRMNEDEATRALFSGNAIRMEDFLSRNNILNNLSNEILTLNNYRNMVTPYNNNLCLGAYNKAASLLPTNAELNQLRAIAGQQKQTFLDKVKTLLSASSQAMLVSESQSWQPSFPQSKESFQKQFKKSLLNLVKEVTEQTSRERELLNSNRREAFLMTELFNVSDTSANRGFVLQPDEYCRQVSLNPLPDAASFQTNKFSVGVQSIRYPEYGTGILAHELGHLTYKALRDNAQTSQQTKAWFDRTKSCLASQHNADGTRFEAEDFADYISAKTNMSQKNPMCLVVGQGQFYPASQFRLDQTNSVDTHSSTIFRALNFEFQQGRDIPAECLAALPEGQTLSAFNRCE